jgi:hypothetical protein
VVVLSLDAYQNMLHDAEEYRMDLRLRTALEAVAKGDRGTPAKTVFDRIRQRAKKRLSESS